MKPMFLDWLIGDRIMQSVCWTLLHSLWQGLLAAIVAAIIIMLTRKSAPEIRYNLLAGLFLLFIATTGITLMRQLLLANQDAVDEIELAISNYPGNHLNTRDAVDLNSTSPGTNYMDKLVKYFNENSSPIVTFWFIIFMAKLARILSNIGYVQRIRHLNTSEPAFHWKEKITGLALLLGVSRSIQLLESAIVRAPVVVGFLKPVILLPFGLLSNIPPEQIEAILLHELAHIRRKDYLVNLVQSFADVVFFFNPALLWISSRVREERENCCDEVAISHTKNKKQFIHALVAFQEYAVHQTSKEPVIAFAGRKNYLLNRVRRIIYNENKKLNAMEKGFFIVSITTVSLVGLLSIKQASPDKVKHSIGSNPVSNSTNVPAITRTQQIDTVPASVEFKSLNSVTNKDDKGATRTITAVDKNGKKYKIIAKNDDPIELYVDDKKIPEGEIDIYKTVIDDIEQGSEMRQKRQIEKMRRSKEEQSEKLSKLEAERLELIQKLAAIDQERFKLNDDFMRSFKDHEWENAANMNLANEKLMKLYLENFNNNSFNDSTRFELNMDNQTLKQLMNENNNNRNQDQLMQNQYNELFQKQLFEEKMNLLHDNEFGLQLQMNGTHHLIDPIIEDMLQQNLIATPEGDLSFELSPDKFIINGKKQPADVHRSFKEKFLKKNTDYFKFSRKNGSINITANSN